MDFQKKFKTLLTKVAKELDKEPFEVTKGEFMLRNGEEITDWDLRKFGNYKTAIEFLYPEAKDLKANTTSKIVRNYKNKVERLYGNQSTLFDEFKEEVFSRLKGEKAYFHRQGKVKKTTKTSRTLVMHLSDLHFGCIVNPKEISNNSFNWTIASRRLAYAFEQVADYKPNHRNETDLAIILNGDIIAGIIHSIESVEPLADQFIGALQVLTQGISFAASKFKHVNVYCTTGNHGRNPVRHKDRAVNDKNDSFETMLYHALKNRLEYQHKNVTFIIPRTIFTDAYIQGHRFYISHGDTGFKLGNIGDSINVRGITSQINKINGTIGVNDPFKCFLFGHLHTPTSMTLENGVEFMINGCLNGVDSYTNSIGIWDNSVVQMIFEVTPENSVGDLRKLRLKTADTLEYLDDIIKPYRGR